MRPFLVIVFVFGSCFICASVFAQNYERVWFDKSDSVYGYYAVIKPVSPLIQGAVVLFDGYGGDATSFLSETKIQNVAAANSMLTICIPTGKRMFLDDAFMVTIKNILNEAAKNCHIKKGRFAMGGFSAGGVVALRYTELCYQHPEEFDIQPGAVFTCDAPIDLLELYQSSKRDLAKKTNAWWLGEASNIIDSLNKNLGELPGAIVNYRKISPFIESDSMPGNEQWLKTVPYRTYHDADINWQLKNRQRSIYEMNMLPASELIRRLQTMGNMQAEFISSTIAGRRSNGQFHPHSWNIIDEIDLVSWIKDKLDFYPGDPAKRYSFNAPGWSTELFLFPFDFAPALPYQGYEELRFAPGWGKAESDEKWAYSFVWWLDGHYTFDENTLTSNLESYFTGLNHRRAVANGDDMKLFFPAKARVKKVETSTGDLATYMANMHIFDAQVTRKPGDLYIKIHVKSCSDDKKTILLFEISGFAYELPVWAKLDKINTDFNCSPQSK